MSTTGNQPPTESLPQLLARYSVHALQTIGKSLGLPTPLPTGRDRLTAVVLAQMMQPDVIHAALERLDEPDRDLLRLLQAMGGQSATQTLRVVALQEGIIEADPPPLHVIGGKKPPPPPSPNALGQVILRLQQCGLVLSPGEPRFGSKVLDFALREVVIIPQPVLQHLPPLPPPNVAYTADAPPTIVSGEASQLQRDLYLYWGTVRDTQVTLTQRGLINKSHLKRINATLTRSENLDNVRDEQQTGWLRFLRGLLTGCQLVRVERNTRQVTVVPDTESFFSRPLVERTRATLDTYRRGTFWNELIRHPHIMIGDYRDDNPVPNAILNARETILRLLRTFAGDGGWLDLRRFLAHMRRTHYDFLLSRQLSSSRYSYRPEPYRSINPYRSYQSPLGWDISTRTHVLDESNGWDAVEAGFVESMLREPLHWLGLVDLGTTADADAPWGDRLEAVRLTPLGAHLLADAPLPEDVEPTGGRLIVQPTFEVLAYPPVSETHLALLDRIAERVRLDQVAVYRLTREALYQASEQHNMSVADVTAALERESGSELPQNVAYTLEEWGRAQERVTLYDQVMLIQADAETLDRLAAWQPATYRRKGEADAAPALLVRRLTPTAALLRRDAHAEIENALFALGNLPVSYHTAQMQQATSTPEHSPAPDLSPRRWLTASADGQLHIQPGAPRLHLRRWLRPFTVEEGEGSVLRVTEAQVQQAVRDGLPVERILGMLRAWSGGDVPVELDRTIQRWGGSSGRATVERPLLLRLSDQRMLETLLADPELGKLLHVYKPQGILAEVQPADMERLRALLAARGIDLTER